MDINTVFIGLYTLLRYFGKYKKKYIFTDAHISALGGHYQNAKMVITLRITLQADPRYQPGIKITDFQMPDKPSDTIKYLLDILKIHQTSCLVIL